MDKEDIKWVAQLVVTIIIGLLQAIAAMKGGEKKKPSRKKRRSKLNQTRGASPLSQFHYT